MWVMAWVLCFLCCFIYVLEKHLLCLSYTFTCNKMTENDWLIGSCAYICIFLQVGISWRGSISVWTGHGSPWRRSTTWWTKKTSSWRWWCSAEDTWARRRSSVSPLVCVFYLSDGGKPGRQVDGGAVKEKSNGSLLRSDGLISLRSCLD